MMRKQLGRIIAACGNDCSACPRYVAYPYEKTEAELWHTAELWMKIGYRDHIVTNEEISCKGCRPENWCRYHVIKCCGDKGISNCSQCELYPCDNIKECFEVTMLKISQLVPQLLNHPVTEQISSLSRFWPEAALPPLAC